jgi:sigma-B regulation protein RsbU (phosphoserine phosphatase)
MPLRTRLTAIATLLVVALGALAMLALLLLQRRHAVELEEALLGQQSASWSEIEQATLAGLGRDAAALAARAGLAAALSAQDRARLGELSDPVAHAVDGRRVDIYDTRGRLAYTKSTAVDLGTLLEPGWLASLNAGAEGLSGVTLIPLRDMFWFRTIDVRDASGRRAGVLALADPVRPALRSLGRSMSAQVYLASSRGRVMQDSGTEPIESLHTTFDARRAQAQHVSAPSSAASASGGSRRELLVTSRPITNPHGRTIGQLVAVRDETVRRRRDRMQDAAMTSAVLLLAAGIAWTLSRYLRRAFDPLRSSLAVLGALADGGGADCGVSPWDERRADEAGAIARGVSALREKVLDLALLREERTRSGEQQERLVRRELRRLAETIDAQSRADVLGELDVDDAQEHQLGRLSKTLGRMTSLISSQHSRLLDVLKELQASVATRALFESLQRELEIASSMQQAILPRAAPRTEAVDVAALMVPAKEVGGDFYDYFVLSHDGRPHLVTVVADVSGKGIPAALFMAVARTLLKGHARLLRSPARVLEVVNDELAEDNEQMMFVTLFLGVIDLESGEMVYVNAGHNPPTLRRGPVATRLEAPANMALGVEPGLTFAEGRVVLERGQQLFLYTDGVTEAMDPEGRLFGEDAMFRALRTADDPAASVVQSVLGSVRAFAGREPQADDITCVVVEFRGTS